MPDTTIDTLKAIINRGLVYAHEYAAIAIAIDALGCERGTFERAQPLMDLLQALILSLGINNAVYLNQEHLKLLAEAIERIQTDAIAQLRRQATVDRLRLMARRSAVYRDDFEDIEMGLDALSFDILKENGGELAELYRDLLADEPRSEPRYLSLVERKALIRAARVMAKGED